MTLNLRTIARALGGEVSGRQVLAPGPNHSPGDRSLSVRLSAQSPTGFIVFSHSGDDFKVSRDYVAERLGFGQNAWRREVSRQIGDTRGRAANDRFTTDTAARIARARAIWEASVDPGGTIVETYLASRGLSLPSVSNVHDWVRFHPRCPWRDEAENRTIYVPAMVAALRSIDGDAITGVHRTRLTPEGAKVDRRMLGQASGSAIKIDPDDAVTTGLGVGEGVETVLAARQLGFKPAWALGSAGAIATFPVLAGIEALTLLAENDPTNARAVETCARRWHQAGREVIVIEPRVGSDLNDAMRGAA